VLVTVVFSAVATWILLKIVDATMGLRATDHNERIGLDLSDHRETGYTMLD